jgi:hypothetical protein
MRQRDLLLVWAQELLERRGLQGFEVEFKQAYDTITIAHRGLPVPTITMLYLSWLGRWYITINQGPPCYLCIGDPQSLADAEEFIVNNLLRRVRSIYLENKHQ